MNTVFIHHLLSTSAEIEPSILEDEKTYVVGGVLLFVVVVVVSIRIARKFKEKKAQEANARRSIETEQEQYEIGVKNAMEKLKEGESTAELDKIFTSFDNILETYKRQEYRRERLLEQWQTEAKNSLIHIAQRDGISVLINAATSGPWSHQTVFTEVFAQIGGKEVIPFLFESAASYSSTVDSEYHRTLDALKMVVIRSAQNEEEAHDAVCQLVDSPDTPKAIQIVLLEALVVADKDTVDSLIPRIESVFHSAGTNVDLVAAINLLGATKSRHFVGTLYKTMKQLHHSAGHYDFIGISAAVRALADIGDPSVLARVNKIVSEIHENYNLSEIHSNIRRLQQFK